MSFLLDELVFNPITGFLYRVGKEGLLFQIDAIAFKGRVFRK